MKFLQPIWQAHLAAGRSDIAFKRLMRQKPKPIYVRQNDGDPLLIHRSTRKPGWWQATFFDSNLEPYADSESDTWASLLEHIRYSADWRTAQAARPSLFPNPGHLQAVTEIAEQAERATLEDFAGYYPKSASGELAEVLNEPRYADAAYEGRNVVWIGTPGMVLKVGPEYVRHIEGNWFDPAKLAAVVAGVKHMDEPVVFHAPYGQASKVDLLRVKESLEYAGDEGLDRPLSTGDEDLDEFLVDPEQWLDDQGLEPGDEGYDEAKQEMEAELAAAEEEGRGDLGEWTFTIRDGNHRAFGSLIAGEPYVWIRLYDTDYEHLKDKLAREQAGKRLLRPVTDEERELWARLH